jgi:electron transport complex protein RnfG
MKYYMKLGFILLLIAAIASGVLALLNSYTKPIIEQNKLKTKEEAQKLVLPHAETFEEKAIAVEKAAVKPDPLKIQKETGGSSKFVYYVGKNSQQQIVGYTFVAHKYGYSSTIETMVGVKPETPGLGANCESEDFTSRFKGLTKTNLLVDKDGGQIKSLTGATISTRTITKSIKTGLQNIETALKTQNTKEVAE